MSTALHADRASFSGELRIERITASSLPPQPRTPQSRVSPYVRVIWTKNHSPTENSRVITAAGDPAIWLNKDLGEGGYHAFESISLAASFVFEIWDKREQGPDVLIGRARVPLSALRACHGFCLPAQDADVDTADGRAAPKAGPFQLEAEDGKAAGSLRLRVALKCPALVDLELFSASPESHILALEQLRRVTLYGDAHDVLGDIRAAYWFDTVAPAPVRVSARRVSRVVELLDSADEAVRSSAAQALAAFALWFDEGIMLMLPVFEQHASAHQALLKALRRVAEDMEKRKAVGLPYTARPTSEIQSRLRELLAARSLANETSVKAKPAAAAPAPSATPAPAPSTAPASTTAAPKAGDAPLPPEESKQLAGGQDEEDEEDEGDEEDDGEPYIDPGVERMVALLAALDFSKYESIIRTKNVSVDHARRFTDAQFREMGLPLGVRVKVMQELQTMPDYF